MYTTAHPRENPRKYETREAMFHDRIITKNGNGVTRTLAKLLDSLVECEILTEDSALELCGSNVTVDNK
jgi:hypothetical protein